MERQKNFSRLHTFIKDVSPTSSGIGFPRLAWVKLNRLRTGVALFRSKTRKWGVVSTAACKCSAKEQTPEHVITSCPIYHHPNEARALSDPGDLADGNMSSHLVDRSAPVYLTQTKKKKQWIVNHALVI